MTKQEEREIKETNRQKRLKVKLSSEHTYMEGWGTPSNIGAIIVSNGGYPASSIKQVLTSHSWSNAKIVYEIESKIVAIRDAKTLELIAEAPTIQEPILPNEEFLG